MEVRIYKSLEIMFFTSHKKYSAPKSLKISVVQGKSVHVQSFVHGLPHAARRYIMPIRSYRREPRSDHRWFLRHNCNCLMRKTVRKYSLNCHLILINQLVEPFFCRICAGFIDTSREQWELEAQTRPRDRYITEKGVHFWTPFVLPQGLEPWTPALRVSCSTNWAREAVI